MKIVRFLGGLGNQMFQYAFYMALEHQFKEVKADINGYNNYNLHNGFELEPVFGIEIEKASTFAIKLYDPSCREWSIRKLRRILNLKNAYQEEKILFSYDDSIFRDQSNCLYWGYWQNEQYFSKIASLIRDRFKFKTPLDEQNNALAEEILSSNSISVHIRRGDYLKDPLLGGICDVAYYKRSIDLMTFKVQMPKYIIFSDDIDWCRNNLQLTDPIFVSWNKGKRSYIDMQLMSLCKHNIIANSSFSWWAAWLNNNEKKIVIAPQNWVNDPLYKNINIAQKEWLSI